MKIKKVTLLVTMIGIDEATYVCDVCEVEERRCKRN
jgi:hypothetical protein